jgi:hypothetical protein
MAIANDATVVPWKISEAKEILKEEILRGNVTLQTNWLVVYNSHPLYWEYEEKHFKVNLKNLIIALEKKEGRAVFERDAVLHDRILHPRPQLTNRGYPFWDTSAASAFLRDDVKDELQKTMSVDQFWRSRAAYQQFPRNVFGKHVSQECNRVKGKSYWLNKRKAG